MMKIKTTHIFFIAGIIVVMLSIFYPMPFIADDWEHLHDHYMGLPPKILFWIHRNPFHSIWHLIYFPVFHQGWEVLAKFLLFSQLLLTSCLLLHCFIPDFRIKMSSDWKYWIIWLALAFPVNNYEWTFWPTMLTSSPSLLLVAIGFHAHFYNRTTSSLILKMVCYTMAALTFECLLVLAWLLELSKMTYFRGHFKIWPILREFILEMGGLTVLFFLFKGLMQYWYPYGYEAKLGFKPWLFGQFLSLIFSIDYYKQLWSLGIPWMLMWGTLILALVRGRSRKMLKKDFLILLFFIASASYYYIVMNYSSRRALAGPIVFSVLVLGVFLDRLNDKIFSKTRAYAYRFVWTVFVLVFFIHQGEVAFYKNRELVAINKMESDLHQSIQLLAPGENLAINSGMPRAYIQHRSWNFIGPTQFKGFILHVLEKGEQDRLEWE